MLSTCTWYTLASSSSRPFVCAPLSASSVRRMGRRTPKPGKPPILPPSKKVLYNVVHVPWMKPEDVKELLWRRHVYNNALISLRNVFKQELQRKEAAGLGVAALRRQEEEELDRLIAENEQRNQEAARLRKEKEEEEMKAAEEAILKEIEAELLKREENVQKRTAEVLDMIERSKNFVTAENLDEKLKEALENPVVYDYAIDLQGHKIHLPKPNKYLEGTPTRQKGRQFDVTLGVQHKEAQAAKVVEVLTKRIGDTERENVTDEHYV
ncbi:unnamed protein product [Toxocara canis]|uniref:Small ribosomal subunit protein mS26 n=1 Tax=Toxocara canis TaxID=6265 RepID=A0A183V8Q2_TOXCA|nr:unnamed protein product [Toxocara canis]